MTSRIKLSIFAASLILLSLSAFPTFAQIIRVPSAPAGATANDVINFLTPFINMAITLIGTLAVIFLVYAGFKYISSRGDEEEAKRAKMQIAYAVIGITVAIGAYTIADAITNKDITDVRETILIPLIQVILTLVGITAAIFLIYAGFKYITSRGDEEEAKQAKMQIAYAVIGITVVLLAVAITNSVITPLGGAPAPNVPGTYALGLIPGLFAVVNSLLSLVGIAAVIFLIYAGVKYISSTGDEEEANQAKRQIVYAIIGLTVVLLSAAIANLVVIPLLGEFFRVAPFYGTYGGTVEMGIRAVVNSLLGLVGIAAAIFLVYAGVKYITSQGDEEETSQAKRQIIYALIGLVVVILSAVIVNLILNTL